MRENYLYGTEDPVLLHHHCYVEYPKDLSLDRSSSFCTRQTYMDSSNVAIFVHTCTRTTHRFADYLLLMKSLLFSSASQPVSPKHRNGWRWTACSWTLNSCGVRHLANRIVYPTFLSTLLWYCTTSEMCMKPRDFHWRPTSQKLSRAASLLHVGFTASGGQSAKLYCFH